MVVVLCLFLFKALRYTSYAIKFTLIVYFRWEKRKLTKWYHRVVQVFVIMKSISTHTYKHTDKKVSLNVTSDHIWVVRQEHLFSCFCISVVSNASTGNASYFCMKKKKLEV